MSNNTPDAKRASPSPYDLLASLKKNSHPTSLEASSSPAASTPHAPHAPAADGAAAPSSLPLGRSTPASPRLVSPQPAAPPAAPQTHTPTHSPAQAPTHVHVPTQPPAHAAAQGQEPRQAKPADDYLLRHLATAGLLGDKADELMASRERRKARMASSMTGSVTGSVTGSMSSSGEAHSTAPAPAVVVVAPAVPATPAPSLNASVAGTASGAPSVATQLLRDQVARLLQDVERKDQELEAERARADAAEKSAESWRISHMSTATESQAELAQTKAVLETSRQTDERQKQRIEALEKALADERAQKDERIQALTRKLHDTDKSVQFHEAKAKRLDEQLQESRKEVALKQQSFNATSTQLDNQVALCNEQKKRIEDLTHEMDARAEKLTGDFSGRIVELKKELEDAKEASKKRTLELEVARTEALAAQSQHAEAMAQQAAELQVAKAQYDRQVEKLEQAVSSMASGRERIVQLQQLHQEMERQDRDFKQAKAELEARISSLEAENAQLADANVQMTMALEGSTTAPNLEQLGRALDSKDAEERIKQLEADTLHKATLLEDVERRRAHLQDELDESKRQLRDRDERVAQLDERLKASQKEVALMQANLDAAKTSAAALAKESESAAGAAKAKISELDAALHDVQAKASDLEAKIKEKTLQHDSMAQELKQLKDRVAEEAAERAAEEKTIRDRLNEAIQERWVAEERVKSMEEAAAKAAAGGPAGAPSTADLERKLQDSTKKLQEQDAQLKQAKREASEAKTKVTALTVKCKDLEEERTKLNGALHQLTEQLLDTERDLEHCEDENNKLAALVGELRAELSKLAPARQ